MMHSKIIWQEKQHFISYDEYKNFYDWLYKLKINGLIEQVSVKEYYAGQNLDEYWFKNQEGKVWRLVAPDFPFEGYWGAYLYIKNI